jgi:hypothetical protein
MSTRLLTNQEVFDKVWDHFITKKNPQSIDINSGTCLYRGPQGERCAAGLFIPDEKYHVELEDASACPLDDFDPTNVKPEDRFQCRVAIILSESVKSPRFLRKLQLLHDHADSSDFTDSFRQELIDLAEKEYLSYPQE